MSFKSSELGKVNTQEVEKALDVFKGLDKDILSAPEHPLAAEYQKISAAAKSILQRIFMTMNMPGGYTAIEQGAEKLGELYARSVEIRSEIAKDLMRREFGVAPGGDIASALEPMVEKATESLGEMGATLAPKFKQVVDTLGMDFSADPKGAVKASNKSLQFLEEARAAGTAAPQIAALANRLGAGIAKMSAINPLINKAMVTDQWYKENFSGKRIDTKPIRMIVALFGSVVTTLNVAYTLKSGGDLANPVIIGWGLVTTLFANPGIVRSSGSRTLEDLAALGSGPVHHAYANGFRGPIAPEALAELQKLRSSKRAELAALQKSDQPLTNAQIGQLAGENSALTKILTGMRPAERAAVLRAFGTQPMTASQLDAAKILLNS